jgi:hypothetical protein
MIPRLYADFQNLDDENRIRLNTVGTLRDLSRLGIELAVGMEITLYTDDADESGQPDDLMVDATVQYSSNDNNWVAAADWSSLRHASEDAIPTDRNGSQSRRPSSAKTT